jgi:hypothetical protein
LALLIFGSGGISGVLGCFLCGVGHSILGLSFKSELLCDVSLLLSENSGLLIRDGLQPGLLLGLQSLLLLLNGLGS